ncbi:MAG: hypothetical protein U0271_47380 [Polyangiaceae bacterium]
MRRTGWASRRFLATVVGLLGASVALGCGDSGENTGGSGAGGSSGGAGGELPRPPQPEGGLPLLGGDCDPMVPARCGLPFPSDVYRLDDPEHPGRKSIRFGATTLPEGKEGHVSIDPTQFYDRDGFSPASALITHLPLATATGCATPHDIARSLDDDSPTVLIDAETGRHIPHWVDLDMVTDHDGLEGRPDERSFMVRPAERLADGRRYIVAIRHVVDHDGVVIEPSKVFEALRRGGSLDDGTEAERWTVYARHDLYKDIFERLGAAGVARDDLQIAWDFTTASRENTTSPLVEMRDAALAAVGAEGPEYEVLNVEEFPTEADHPYLLRRFELRMTVPVYLTNGAVFIDSSEPAPHLNYGADGKLEQNGTMTMDVLVLVPRSVLSGEKHGLLQNGHGLFGSRDEGRNSFLARAANESHYIVFSVNFFGFDEDALDYAGQILLGRHDAMASFSERQIQGMVNQLLAMRMMRGRVAHDGVHADDGRLLLAPSWVDPTLRAYRGDSQGGIMGATYMSVSTDVTRGLLGEPGMGYSLLLNRSVDWAEYETLLKVGYGENPIDLQIFLGVLQLGWDRVEPAGFAPYLRYDTLPGTPAHRVILSAARGDHQVTTYAAHILARAIGAVELDSNDPNHPVHEEIFGLPRAAGPLGWGSALVEYDFGLEPNPDINVPNTSGCDPHDRVRALDPSFTQQDRFFRTGLIEPRCDGVCNCDDTLADPHEEGSCRESYAAECE